MKVTFIKHSCYHVELEHCCLLFDYYEGTIPETGKPLCAFASHSHGDHFSEELFGATADHPEAMYLLSQDIFKSRVPERLKERTVFVKPHQTYEVGSLKVATLKSTDAGVAFLVQCENKLLYHAGDLNCWVWDGAPRFQNDQMTAQYKRELEALSGREIDVAFVPLDPRQEADFDLGMKYFFQTVTASGGAVDNVFPMHMWGDYSVVPLFKSTPGYEEYAKVLMDVKMEQQEFVLE